MVYYTLPLEHKQAKLEFVGGKGMSLSKLLTAGIPVPNGFHVTTASYRIFVERNHIQPHINKLLDGIDSNNTTKLEDVSARIGMLFHNGEIPQEVSTSIKTAYAGLGNLTVAVRSSATAEDLPDASFAVSETLFAKIFQGAARRAGITDTSVFLLGFNTIALQAEKSLWGISEWAKQKHTLSFYLQNNPATKIAEDFMSTVLPDGVSQEVWIECINLIDQYFKEFGRTSYEFDFAYSTPQETLTPTLESIKTFVEGKAESPFLRQATFEKRRKQAEAEILQHIGGLRKKLFYKLLHWAQETAPMRENAIYSMGMGHPLLRSMFKEISECLIRGGAISNLQLL
jgi:hypothetical protein